MQIRNSIFWAAVLILLPILVGVATARPFMALATLSYALLCRGLYALKADRTSHPRWMAAGILLDLSLVLILQIQRQAIQEATSGTLPPLQMAHVGFSTLATMGYLGVLPVGIALVRKPELRNTALKIWHGRFGAATFLARTLGFFLMFSML